MAYNKNWYHVESQRAASRRYEKTPQGYLRKKYYGMKSRILGRTQKPHLYVGKSLLEQDEFLKWANGSPEFISLFKQWEESSYERKLAPSVDRIDPALGYELGNIRWLTQSENSRLGGINRAKMGMPNKWGKRYE